MENTPLRVSWEEKKKELPEFTGDEKLLAQAWEMGEDFVFLYIMYLSVL